MLWILQRNKHGFWLEGAQPSALSLTNQPSIKYLNVHRFQQFNFTERIPLFFLRFIAYSTSSSDVTSKSASPLFVEPETSLPFSHRLVTGPYLTPYISSSYPPIHILQILFNSINIASLGLHITLFSSGFPTKTMYAIGSCNMGFPHSASYC